MRSITVLQCTPILQVAFTCRKVTESRHKKQFELNRQGTHQTGCNLCKEKKRPRLIFSIALTSTAKSCERNQIKTDLFDAIKLHRERLWREREKKTQDWPFRCYWSPQWCRRALDPSTSRLVLKKKKNTVTPLIKDHIKSDHPSLKITFVIRSQRRGFKSLGPIQATGKEEMTITMYCIWLTHFNQLELSYSVRHNPDSKYPVKLILYTLLPYKSMSQSQKW